MALQKLSHSYTKIGFKPLQTTVRHILYSLSFSLFCICQSIAQETNKTKEVSIPVTQKDTLSDTLGKQEVKPEIALRQNHSY